jgi:putative heme-binding domain-containing protein
MCFEKFLACLLICGHLMFLSAPLPAETLRHPLPLEQQLKQVPVQQLVDTVMERGDAQRGALVFYKSAAACSKCHSSGKSPSPLGPDLATIGNDERGDPVTEAYLIESLLYPSKSIRKAFQTVNIVTSDGEVISGLQVKETETTVELRDATDTNQTTFVNKDEIEAIKRSPKSMMPEGLVASLNSQRDFVDLAAYVIAVAQGGKDFAEILEPSADDLAVKDDSVDLDHAGIISGFRTKDFDAGEKIYHGYCFNCHGSDGNTPSLPAARAFGTQELKFGADPYAMFMTLTKGNGLMSPMSHLTPKERYQVVHYIRAAFMKDSNPGYSEPTDDYLAGLPKGTQDGTYIQPIERDYGPALASQLRRDFSSVLTIDLRDLTVSYDLHTLNAAGAWYGEFLDLTQTQHARDRGEGTANPSGETIDMLADWKWGHDGTLDYPTEGLRRRGALPDDWMKYFGHYLHGKQVTLSYAIDGREILEHPRGGPVNHSLTRYLQIGPGKELILAVTQVTKPTNVELQQQHVRIDLDQGGHFAARIDGDKTDTHWTVDSKNRVVLRIPADQQSRMISVSTAITETASDLVTWNQADRSGVVDLQTLTLGGPLLWPREIETKGHLGLEQGGYALDTLTIPDETPWNTWFRTSALDFFPDGRMALATYGGDVWIVSGVDDDLLNLKWKRFAGGLYEPMGLKVIDNLIYVTCKDRLTRLRDQNSDGEADFYESFSADEDVSVNFHAFNFDLQVDDDGYLYYAKSGHGSDSDIPGCIVKVSPNGKQRSVYATGFRTPNGMGAFPDGRLTVSDNQGQWTPAGKISLLRSGGYYGWVNNYSIPGMWEPGGGLIDLAKVVPPDDYDAPLVWMPQEFDNSSGGQIFAGDDSFGPLHGRMLHTSFGKGWLSYLMTQEVHGDSQAAIIKLPFDFQTGIMRGRTNPTDGQVYATGLQGWNGGGRTGLLGQGVQRLRYTGKPYRMVTNCQVESDGLRVAFNFALDDATARDVDSYKARQWNYLRQKSYGSDQYSPSTGKKGFDKLNIISVDIHEDGKSVLLRVPNLRPVDQVHLTVNLEAEDGAEFAEEIYWTINRVPKRTGNQVPEGNQSIQKETAK